MKYYTSTTEFNCGIDLHARQMYVCLMDRQGKKLIHTKRTRRVRDSWEEQLLKAENHPLRQIALKNDLAMIGHFDQQIFQLEEELQRQTKQVAARDYALLQTVPGIGETLGLTILHEIGDIARFPTVKDFVSYCRLVKGTVASAGKIKGLRGAKLGNPYLRWAFGEAAVIAKRDHHLVRPLSQRLEAHMNGNKFKANTVLAIKLARAVYFMLKNKTVFDPERLVASLQKCFSPGRRQPGRLTGRANKAMPPSAADHVPCAPSTPVCVGQASSPAALIGTCGQRLDSVRAGA
jgi:hypothetical protein